MKGENKYYVDAEWRVFTKINNKIEPIIFQAKVQIISVIASYRFIHFLSSNGQLYSKGTNKNGELGMDRKVSFVEEPIVN